MEAKFLEEIKLRLTKKFYSEPSVALADAAEALKSEAHQIICLAETQQLAFEACWTALNSIKNTNRFAAALFRRADRKGLVSGGKWSTGAALVYQARCAIVHAGEKDMIFENFDDGQQALEVMLPHVERAALLIMGLEFS